MGVNDRVNEAREQKRNAKRRKAQQSNEPVSVDDINSDTLLYCIHNVLRGGGALRIGRTRDAGAWAFGVYGDGNQPYTEYVRGNEDVNVYLKGLGDFFATEGPPEP